MIGRVCKQRLLYYAKDEDEQDDFVENECKDMIGDTKVAHLNSLEGSRRSRPLKVVGVIQDREVCILIDTGSDRDFLHTTIAETLHLPLSPIRPFRVYVGNGEALLCTHMSKQTKVKIQGSVFVIDLHILPVHGPDVVLGMDWLESLGKISADFAG